MRSSRRPARRSLRRVGIAMNSLAGARHGRQHIETASARAKSGGTRSTTAMSAHGRHDNERCCATSACRSPRLRLRSVSATCAAINIRRPQHRTFTAAHNRHIVRKADAAPTSGTKSAGRSDDRGGLAASSGWLPRRPLHGAAILRTLARPTTQRPSLSRSPVAPEHRYCSATDTTRNPALHTSSLSAAPIAT